MPDLLHQAGIGCRINTRQALLKQSPAANLCIRRKCLEFDFGGKIFQDSAAEVFGTFDQCIEQTIFNSPATVFAQKVFRIPEDRKAIPDSSYPAGGRMPFLNFVI